MSRGSWYPAAPAAAGQGRRRWAAGLLGVASVLATLGASGALVLYTSPAASDGTVLVQVRTGWNWAFWGEAADTAGSAFSQLVLPSFFALAQFMSGTDMVEIPGNRLAAAPLVGAPVVLGALLAFVVAVLVLASGSRPLPTGSGLAALAAGLLVGGAASIGLDVAAELDDARGPGSVWQLVQVGMGTWFVLGAALVALVAVVLVARPAIVPDQPARGPGIVLLPVVAALAIGGSFGPHVVGRGVSAGSPWTSTYTEAGSSHGFDAPLVAPTESAPQLGIPLGVAAALALLATLVLVLRTGHPAPLVRGRLLGVGASGLVVAVAAHVWLDVAAAMRNAGVLAAAGHDVVAAPGLGAWFGLAAGVLAVAVIALLLVRA